MKASILVKGVRWQGGGNPAFQPGEMETAVAEFLNPTAFLFPYSAKLYLDKPALAGSDTVFFNIDAGSSKSVSFPVTMPSTEGTYPVYLDIFSDDQLIEAFQDIEDVVIAGPLGEIINPDIKLSNPSVSPPTGYVGDEFHAAVTVQGAFEEPISGDILLEWNGRYQVKNTGGLRWDDKKNIIFAIVPEVPGTYRVKFNNVADGTFTVLPIPVGPAPGWLTFHPLEVDIGPDFGIDYDARRKNDFDWKIRRKGYTERKGPYCANAFACGEKELENMGIDATGCYGNRQACVGRVGVLYNEEEQQTRTTTVTGFNNEGYCVKWEYYNRGLDDPECRAYFKLAMPSDCYMVMQFYGYLAGPTSINAMLSQLEAEGAADILKVVESGEYGISWVRLTMFDASKFLDIIADSSGWTGVKVYGPGKLV